MLTLATTFEGSPTKGFPLIAERRSFTFSTLASKGSPRLIKLVVLKTITLASTESSTFKVRERKDFSHFTLSWIKYFPGLFMVKALRGVTSFTLQPLTT